MTRSSAETASSVLFGQTEPSCRQVTLTPSSRTKRTSHARPPPPNAWWRCPQQPRRLLRLGVGHAGDRLVDQQQLPGPGRAACRSPAIASGRATGWQPACWRLSPSRTMPRISSTRAVSTTERRCTSAERTERGPFSDRSRLSSTVWLSNTAARSLWNLRPIPIMAMSASSWRVRSMSPLKTPRPHPAASCR